MVPTGTWYSAYPTLSVENIRNNMGICAGLSVTPGSRPRATRG